MITMMMMMIKNDNDDERQAHTTARSPIGDAPI